MAELTTTKLNAEAHLLLDQPLLRLPYELTRHTFKTAQRYLEKDTSTLLSTLQSTTSSATKTASPAATLDSLDGMIAKMQGLKRKLEGLHEEEVVHLRSSRKRVDHLKDLYEVASLVDVKYEEWSRIRLTRLLVDYLLRMGYTESAAQLAASKNVTELVDVDAFVVCQKIERSLRQGRRTDAALSWCAEHKQALKKGGWEELEFDLRLQQYVELVRQGHEAVSDDMGSEGMGMGMGMEDGGIGIGGDSGENTKLAEARAHAKKYLAVSADFDILGKAAGLLAYKPWDEVEPYATLYSPNRWDILANKFLTTFYNLYSLPPRPLLHIALSAGLSALKTPSCHSQYTSSSANASSSTTTVCPICSTELNSLARNVPYAHHTKSIVENDPVVLPNGRVYGRERLRTFNEKVGTEPGYTRDPVGGVNGERYREIDVRKVYIL
ncbi:protein FYV10 [Amniculicola lignicola CBS 123094]|uniref:Protein FYV10 n=1 Tax=Amniculicola lignicola CBS 123094 TaxID=1392246 RepID=A0A6A5WUL9_9PLEO|nr:protein FYV10 [Amniculicola lignicola CBS 123094]